MKKFNIILLIVLINIALVTSGHASISTDQAELQLGILVGQICAWLGLVILYLVVFFGYRKIVKSTNRS
jgi:hypothetical protein